MTAAARTPDRLWPARVAVPSAFGYRVTLARCSASENGAAPDQTAYEPQFRGASDVLANYRQLLGVRHTILAELAQIPGPASQSGAKQKSVSSSEQKK